MKTVIVTGASKGIGAAICRSLRVQGVRVIGVARNEAALASLAQEKIGPGPMEFVAGDVTSEETLQAALRLTQAHQLEALIFNAGTLGPVAPLAAIKVEEIQMAFAVNLFSAMRWVQGVLPALRQTHGRIILTSSGVASIPYAAFAAYCSSKAALNSLAAVLALEEPTVTSMAVEPGVVATDMSREFLEKGRPYLGPQQVAFLEASSKLAQPEDVAGAYTALALRGPKEKSGQFLNWNDSWIKTL